MRPLFIAALLLAAVILAPAHLASQGAADAYPFRDPNLPDDARIRALKAVGCLLLATATTLDEALACGATMVLLDNMDIPTLQEAVRRNAGRAILEISGGVNLDTVRALAETGVDRISIGALTKDVKATDFSMRMT